MYFALIASFRYVRLSFNVRVKFKHFVSKNKVFINNTVVHSVLSSRFLAKSAPLFGKLNNSVQSKDIFMISKVGSRIMIILSCLVICRPNLTSRMSSTTPGLEMSDKENLDSWNQRFLIGSLYKTCS